MAEAISEADGLVLQAAVERGLITPAIAEQLKAKASVEQPVAALLVSEGYLTQHLVSTLIAGNVPPGLIEQPTALGGYKILTQIGQGGMGTVFKAVQTSLGREVALKVIGPPHTADKAFCERFLREARVAAQINHPNVITVFDAGQDRGYLYMALELVGGGDAGKAATADGGRMEEARALRLASDCCHGLIALDHAGLIHRDIKPANVFLLRGPTGERAKLADLGLARSLSGEDKMTQTGASMGTPAFMSPEQANGDESIDIRTDLYALGATLYALLTGEPPYKGTSVWSIMAQVLKDPVPDPRAVQPGISNATASVVIRCLAKERGERYASPQELLEDLECASGNRPLRHARLVQHPSRTWDQLAGGGPLPRHVSREHPTVNLDRPLADTLGREDDAASGRRLLPWAAVGIAAGVGVVLLAMYALERIPKEPPTRPTTMVELDPVALGEDPLRPHPLPLIEPTVAERMPAPAAPALVESLPTPTPPGPSAPRAQPLVTTPIAPLALPVPPPSEPGPAPLAVIPAPPFAQIPVPTRPAPTPTPIATAPQPPSPDATGAEPTPRATFADELDAMEEAPVTARAAVPPARAVVPPALAAVPPARAVVPPAQAVTPPPTVAARVPAVATTPAPTPTPPAGTPLAAYAASRQAALTRDGFRCTLTVLPSGKLAAVVLDRAVRDLEPLRGLPLESLDIEGCDRLTGDLSALTGMPLRTLKLAGCKRLENLRGVGDAPLETVTLAGCAALTPDLAQLAGTRITRLDATGCRALLTLDGLQNLPLTEVVLRDCANLTSIAALRGTRLTRLDAHGCGDLASLEGLAGLPLTEVDLSGCRRLNDLTPLAGAPLRRLLLHECSRLTSLTGIEIAALTELDLRDCSGLLSLGPLRGAKGLSRLDISGCTGLTTLDGLQGVPLSELRMYGCRNLTGDFSALRGAPLTFLDASYCSQMTSFEGLQKAPLRTVVLLRNTGLTDTTPLAGIPGLEITKQGRQ